jgi:hypothetical protein
MPEDQERHRQDGQGTYPAAAGMLTASGCMRARRVRRQEGEMSFAREDSFRRYLRMGREWPQLRGPLAIALLASAKLDMPDPHCLFDARGLTDEQKGRTAATAESLHRHFRIPARPLTPEMAQTEWRRALSAASYIALNLLAEHPHRRYDPYHDYIDEADRAGMFERLRCDPGRIYENLVSAMAMQYALLSGERELGALFRTTYLPQEVRLDWLRANGNAPPGGLDPSSVLRPRDCRRAILRLLRDRMLPLLDRLPAKARMAAAMGIDWKVIET